MYISFRYSTSEESRIRGPPILLSASLDKFRYLCIDNYGGVYTLCNTDNITTAMVKLIDYPVTVRRVLEGKKNDGGPSEAFR